jgi:hypothetical protein
MAMPGPGGGGRIFNEIKASVVGHEESSLLN